MNEYPRGATFDAGSPQAAENPPQALAGSAE